MSQPPELKPLIDDSADVRSPKQYADEQAMGEIAGTISGIEDAIRRADKARKNVSRMVDNPNLIVALNSAISQLEAVRKELFQSTYFGGDQQRIF
ncbi:hypothetical protein [Microbispora bryophytorum]|uniref:hypothetical protein n=1 Tax=Microbispora bryophytorum TaxID=1460882 RepID=UPI0033DE7684